MVQTKGDTATQQRYYTQRQLEAWYQRSGMTIHRWGNDPKLGFPQPIRIRGRKLWPVEAIEAWDKDRAKEAALAAE